jgi:hypothetical protein
MREYIKKPVKADYEWWDTPNTESLAKTVYETDELFDTGVLDEAGNKIMAREKRNPIGFVRFPVRGAGE